MEERRRATRRKSYLGGNMAFSKGAAVVDCLVRDLTDEGAKVECSSTLLLPRDVELTIACKGLQGRAHIVWRNVKQAGLTFTTGLAPVCSAENVIPIGTAHLIAKLQAANADLRRRVARLSDGS